MNHLLSAADKDPKPLERLDPRKPIIEQYIHVRNKIKNDIARVCKYCCDVPNVCWIIELYKSPTSKAKSACFRCSFCDPETGNLISYHLGALEYNPSYNDRKSSQASALLKRFAETVMKEYDLSPDNCLTSSVDNGPDVKLASSQLNRQVVCKIHHTLEHSKTLFYGKKRRRIRIWGHREVIPNFSKPAT